MSLYVQLPDRLLPDFGEDGRLVIRRVPGSRLPVLDDTGGEAGKAQAGGFLRGVERDSDNIPTRLVRTPHAGA